MLKMKINNTKKNIYILFSIFYLSLLFGFYFNEDSAGGALQDYIYHLNIRNFFLDSNLYGLSNYLETKSNHSPIFIIFLKYILSQGELIGRLIFLNICIISPIIFFKTLKKKIKINTFYIFYLSNFFFLSPYFRSTSIWPGDENIAILFFLICSYFYISYTKAITIKEKTNFMIYNIIFLALSSYFRPIYSIFSIFFFYEFVLKNNNFKFFLIYFVVSLFLAFPAIYYVFILKNNFFYSTISQFNFFNTLGLFYTTIFFYLLPFIFIASKSFKNFKVNYLNLSLTILFSILIYNYFNYQYLTGGGIFFKIQQLFADNNLFFTIIFAISFYFTNQILELYKFKNLIILLILMFFEIDGQFYMETYDPLFLICLFLFFDTKLISAFFSNNVLKNINIVFFYLILFFFTKLTYVYLIL
tara:strand:+ start:3536 stop:4780 length:1245 start_codon:yes stop_codon:yes gene_type:complete